MLGSEHVIQTPGETHKAVFLECGECEFWMAGDDSEAARVPLHFDGEYHRINDKSSDRFGCVKWTCPDFKLRDQVK